MDIQTYLTLSGPYNGALATGAKGAVLTGADVCRHIWAPCIDGA